MACMEHWCYRCKIAIHNNAMGETCPKCGEAMRSFYDEEYADTGEEETCSQN